MNRLDNIYSPILKDFCDLFFYKRSIGFVCKICPHNCNLNNGVKGYCGNYMNMSDEIYSLDFLPVSVEEENIAHNLNLKFLEPSCKVWVVGFYGCNLYCKYCINFSKSYVSNFDGDQLLSRNDDSINKNILNSNCDWVLFSVSEPMIHVFRLLSLCEILKRNKKRVVIATNGFFSQKIFEKINPFIDSFRIDLKGFSEKIYREVTGSKNIFSQVKKRIEYLVRSGMTVELTFCVIPSFNYNIESLYAFSKWMKNIDSEISITLLRFILSSDYKSKQHGAFSELRSIKRIFNESGLSNVFFGGI